MLILTKDATLPVFYSLWVKVPSTHCMLFSHCPSFHLLCLDLNKGHKPYKASFFSPPFLTNISAALTFLSVSAAKTLKRVKGASPSLSINKTHSNFLDSGKTDFVISAVFCFSLLLIHLVSKGVKVVFTIFTLLAARKAQVNGQTWVLIKRDFLSLKFCTACFVYKYIFKNINLFYYYWILGSFTLKTLC